MTRQPFDLVTPAPNGLRRGYTTGSSATAAVKAALWLLQRGEALHEVDIALPDPAYYLTVPVHKVERLGEHSARAEVIKFGGDDPDKTDGATIWAEVTANGLGELRFLAGEGVGTVTQPGIRVPVGEPAINPTPRQMMAWVVDEVMAGVPNPGFDLTIGCVNGAEIAKKTFNPRLGIVGGISILGTSGIVQPMSLSAWIASIEVYIRVALGDHPDAIAFTPGKIGAGFARQVLHMQSKQIVQIANFIGASLEHTQQILQEEQFRLPVLWVLGHPGKIAKVLDGVWDTHSGKSGMAMATVMTVAADCGFEAELVSRIAAANTVENVIQILHGDARSQGFWTEIEQRTARLMHEKAPSAQRVEVRLFAMNGTPIGAGSPEECP